MGFKDDFTMLYTHFSEDKETQPDFFSQLLEHW